jgi:hypothetical protein
MTKATEKFVVDIDADSELGRVLAAAGREPVRLILNDQQYVAARDPINSVDHSDPEAFREALRAAAGLFTPEEGERLKRMIYPWRDEEGLRTDPPELDTELVLAAVRAVMGPLAEEEAGQIKALMLEGCALRSRQMEAS